MNDDNKLQRDILDELEWEPRVEASEIGVTVDDGVATLAGRVTTYAEKVAAAHAALRVAGVRAVANDVEVRLAGTGERTDADIARAAADALKWRSSIPGDRIKVAVSGGWITLEGEVDWEYQRQYAHDAVSHLFGVKGVVNDLVARPKAAAPGLKSRIEEAFRRSAEVDAGKVRVEVLEGKVTLRGDVRSHSEREEAERTAWAAPGVVAVEKIISVSPDITADPFGS